jgi:hypothetical protein
MAIAVAAEFHRHRTVAVCRVIRLRLSRLDRSGAETYGGEAQDAKKEFTHLQSPHSGQ